MIYSERLQNLLSERVQERVRLLLRNFMHR